MIFSDDVLFQPNDRLKVVTSIIGIACQFTVPNAVKWKKIITEQTNYNGVLNGRPLFEWPTNSKRNGLQGAAPN